MQLSHIILNTIQERPPMISYQDVQFVRDSDIPASAKHILLELLFRANDRRICWPALSTIASDTGLSKATVRRMLRLLVERELIDIQVNPTGGANNYMIYDMGYHGDTPPLTMVRGGITVTGGGVTEDMGGVTVTPHERDRKKNEVDNEGTPAQTTEGEVDFSKIQDLWHIKIYEEFRIVTLNELLINYTPDQIIQTLEGIPGEQIPAKRMRAHNLHRILKREHDYQ